MSALKLNETDCETAVLRALADDLGPRILTHLFRHDDPAKREEARTLHTELRKALELLRGAETW